MELASQDFISFGENLTLSEVRATLRQSTLWGLRCNKKKIVYLYVVDKEAKLVGAVNLEALASVSDTSFLHEIVDKQNAFSISENATVAVAIEQMLLTGVSALPILSHDKKILGIIDYHILGGKPNWELEKAEEEAVELEQELTSIIGFDQDRMKGAKLFTAFLLRCPWLSVTIVAGSICAILLEADKNLSLKLPLLLKFLPLLLAVADAICHQASCISIGENLGGKEGNRKIFSLLKRELKVCLALGLLLSVVVGCFVSFIFKDWNAGLGLGVSLLFSCMAAGIIGLLIPAAIRFCRGNPDTSAGPLALGFTDLTTIVILIIVVGLIA